MDNRRINLTNDKIGNERRQEILDGIKDNGTFLPQPVQYDDIDRAVLDFMDKEIDLIVKSKNEDDEVIDLKVPVFFLTIQRWGEFTKTWGSSDKYKDVKLPFITVVRNPDIQQGTNQNQFWNIPGRQNWVYHKVPTLTNGRVGMDLYKIPQPTSVDMTFNIRFFSNRMSELNELQDIIQRKFNALQHYIYVKGHPMPLHLESVADESKLDDMDARKYYVQTFEILCKGYILNEEDFAIVPTVDRAVLNFNGGGAVNTLSPKFTRSVDKENSTIEYFVTFSKLSKDFIEIKMNDGLLFQSFESYELDDAGMVVYVNDSVVEFPFTVKRNDVLKVKTVKTHDGVSTLKLVGEFNFYNNTYMYNDYVDDDYSE